MSWIPTYWSILSTVSWKRSPNDNIADDNNLSDGELELGEAVISVNQYIVQPMGAHTDVSFSSAGRSPSQLLSFEFIHSSRIGSDVFISFHLGVGDLDTNEIFRLVDQSFNPFSLDRNNTTVIASNVSVDRKPSKLKKTLENFFSDRFMNVFISFW